ncbi:hypothetical protein [Porphyrobacter sp. AAP60]|uniref:hypothetical protein n=1 Tax=Porphyrobacter sp. AAP60 TaxID=1523423 RepID=UPI0018D1C4D0|nr:hypothetical protein [Porphyrobacter sp. AAP60]
MAAHIDIRQSSCINSAQLVLCAERLRMRRLKFSGGFTGHANAHDAEPLRKVLTPTGKTRRFQLMLGRDERPERLQLGLARCILIRQAVPEIN